MKACGVIVEYNPFHNGHQYHIKEAKRISKAHCIIAIMSGPFLQRGEPAIIDKFHRAKAALKSGIDLIIELPYRFAVQSSENFGKGAVLTLNEIGVSSICFGSESGDINQFKNSYKILKQNKTKFNKSLQHYLNEGYSYPKANHLAYKNIKLTDIDMVQPNNILGFSYVQTILNNNLDIEPLTIKRLHSDYHDKYISHKIASATSIRESLIKNGITDDAKKAFPNETLDALNDYKKKTKQWHHWEDYFPFLSYRIMTMSHAELRNIKGVDEGLEHRIKEKIKHAYSFTDLMKRVKTKRYTWTRLQRMFTHILTNTLKDDYIINKASISYIRVLGMTQNGRKYLNKIKSDLNVPLVTRLSRHHELRLDERASRTYYSILPPRIRKKMFQQEIQKPIML